MTAGLGLAGLGAAALAEAQPAPFPDYHWCPGQWWDPGWGDNWDGGRCHDDHWFDGEGRDRDHWHNGPYAGEATNTGEAGTATQVTGKAGTPATEITGTEVM